jgi:hypothetical protein
MHPQDLERLRDLCARIAFSYGFLGRNPHQALWLVRTAIMSRRVNWVLDPDIRSFLDSVDHEWLARMLRTGSPILDYCGSSADEGSAGHVRLVDAGGPGAADRVRPDVLANLRRRKKVLRP